MSEEEPIQDLPGDSWFFPVEDEFKVAQNKDGMTLIFIEHQGTRIVLNDLVQKVKSENSIDLRTRSGDSSDV